MKSYHRLPITLYRIQPKLPVGLRDFAIQQQLGRTSFDLKVHDGFVKPLSDSSKFTTPNGMSLRPVGENMLKILSAFKGEPLVYRLHEGLELPKGFIVYHEHTDHYSLQTSEDISLEKLNSKLTDFLKSMPSQTKSQFFSQLEDEDDFDN
jgi:hypothetical protein